VLARGGFDIVLVARSRDTLEAAAGQLEGQHDVTVHVFAADLRRPDAPEAIYDFLSNENIPIEVLVNNAGFGLGGEFAETELTRELEMIQVNIAALTHLTKLFLPQMIKRRSGRILNVASTAAFQPGPLMAVYYASKAYVLSFSEAIAEELRNTGVTVTALCPGPTRTDFAETAKVGNSRLFSLFGLADAAGVAEYGFQAMMQGRRVAIPGIRNRLVAVSNRFSPRVLTAKISRLAQESR
jgi:short-subunit dehydrogenase